MANSLIEDVLNDPIDENIDRKKGSKKAKPKKSKKIIIFFIIVLIIIVVCTIGVILYLQKMSTKLSSKLGFFEYITSNNLESVMELSSYEEVLERLLDENSTIETSVDISYTSESFSISDIELLLNSEIDAKNGKGYVDANITYSNNDLFSFEMIILENSIALKSDEIVNAFLDIPYDYEYDDYAYVESDEDEGEDDEDTIDANSVETELETSSNVLEEVGATNVLTNETNETDETDDNTNTENISNSTYELEDDTDSTEELEDEEEDDDDDEIDTDDNINILKIKDIVKLLGNADIFSNESFQIYQDILDKNLDDTHFSDSSVVLSLDAGEKTATKYTLTMTAIEFLNIFEECLEMFETDTDTIEALSDFLAILEITEEDFVNSIDDLIDDLETFKEECDENIIVEIAVYESDGQTVEIVFRTIKDETVTNTFEIQYEYDSNENSVKFSYVDENNDGLSLKITNTLTDLASKIDVICSEIETNEVLSTITCSFNLVGSNDSYSLDAGVYYQDTSENSVNVSITNEIEFTDNVDILELTDENSTSIEDLSHEQVTEIYEQFQTVLSEKIAQISFIDTNTDEVYVDQNSSDEDDETKKEEAKNALILAVQEEMTLALENDEEYTIQDLADLEVDGYIVAVAISEDIATIDMNGYTFYIDSEFNLSE